VTEARLVLSTCADRASAETLARVLVEERLAACVNLVPGIHSIYRWQGGVETADEVLLVIKTTAARVDPLTRRIEALHDYEVPEVIVLEAAGGGAPYLAWLSASVHSEAEPS
jgi:periplasmic divalent cation tolerance protein